MPPFWNGLTQLLYTRTCVVVQEQGPLGKDLERNRQYNNLQAAKGTCSVALFHYLTKVVKQTRRNDKKETLQTKEIFRRHNFFIEL